jgi:hypothetical protein
VIGVPGVGEHTAIKYLNGQLSYGRKQQSIGAYQEQIALNRRLVQLPFDGHSIIPTSVMATWESSRLGVSESGFQRVCEKYGLTSFLEPQKYREWAAAFRWGQSQ